MHTLKAKPVSQDFWILKDKDKKVGKVIHNEHGYNVSINNETKTYTSLEELKKAGKIEFIDIIKSKPTNEKKLYNFPTNTIPYNGVWNVQYRLPLFTLEEDSKSWHAAGWYKIYIKKKEEIQFCPKLITLQRNKYEGPYMHKPNLIFEDLFE